MYRLSLTCVLMIFLISGCGETNYDLLVHDPVSTTLASDGLPPEMGKDEQYSSFVQRWNAWVDSLPDDQKISCELGPTLERKSEDRFEALSDQTTQWPAHVLTEARPWNEYWDDAQLVQTEFKQDLDQLNALAHRPFLGVNIPFENANSVEIELPSLQITNYSLDSGSLLRSMTRNLNAQAVYLASTGETDQAIERFQSVATLCDRTLELPGITSWLVEIAMRAALASTMIELVEYDPDLFSDDQLAAIQSILVDDLHTDMARVFAFNQLMTLEEWKLLFHSFEMAMTNRELKDHFHQIMGSMGMFYESDNNPFVDIPDPDTHTPIASLKEQVRVQSLMFDAMVNDLGANPATQRMPALNIAIKEYLSGEDANRFVPAFAEIRLWRFSLGLVHQYNYETTNQIVILALHRHRLKTGSWPASLVEIDREYLPTDAIDLYSGQPLRYARLPNQSRLWALGVDRNDDGGRSITPSKKGWRVFPSTWFSLDEWDAMSDETQSKYDGDILLFKSRD